MFECSRGYIIGFFCVFSRVSLPLFRSKYIPIDCESSFAPLISFVPIPMQREGGRSNQPFVNIPVVVVGSQVHVISLYHILFLLFSQ